MNPPMPDKWQCKYGRKYLCEATGASEKTVNELVANGTLPGIIDKGFIILTPGQYLRWWNGDWTPRPAPIDMHRSTRKSA